MNIVIVGPGRMGTALARAMQVAGCRVTAAYSRDLHGFGATRFTALTHIPVHTLAGPLQPLQDADIVLVSVPDKAVTDTAQTLYETGLLDSRMVIAHTAGALSSNALHPVTPSGCATVSLHPLQTIADPTVGAEILRGAYCSLEGDPRGTQVASSLVQSWGGIPVVISAEQRPQYHAAAVLASNALIALTAVATDVMQLPEGLQALLPLIKGAVANLERKGLPNALTGPIERGDVSTVHAHLQALQSNPTARHVYTTLGQVTTSLAQQKGSLSGEQVELFRHLFNDSSQR